MFSGDCETPVEAQELTNLTAFEFIVPEDHEPDVGRVFQVNFKEPGDAGPGVDMPLVIGIGGRCDPDSPLDVRLGVSVDGLSASPDGIVVTLRRSSGSAEEVVVDRIVSLTGSVGDARMYRQLQVHECYATSGPMKLAAALLASTSADCLTQESQGADTLHSGSASPVSSVTSVNVPSPLLRYITLGP